MRISQVDFMRSPSQPQAAWWVLAAGAIGLGASFMLTSHWRAEQDAAALQDQAREATRVARLQPPSLPPLTLPRRRADQAKLQLNEPWAATLGSIESVTHEPIYLLLVSIDPATGAIRLEGEAPDFDHVLAYVQSLDAAPALVSATLESHGDVGIGTGSTAPAQSPVTVGAQAVHFSVLAHWRMP